MGSEVTESRYWVSYKRAFATPLSRSDGPATATYFGRVADELRRLGATLESGSVSLSDFGGITFSGVVRATDQPGALAAAEAAFGLALTAAGPVPPLPAPPHGPSWRAHELLGVATSSVKLLTAA